MIINFLSYKKEKQEPIIERTNEVLTMFLLSKYLYIELYTIRDIESLKPILTTKFLPWEGGAGGGRQRPDKHIKKGTKVANLIRNSITNCMASTLTSTCFLKGLEL